MSDRLPEYQRRMMGQPPEPRYQPVASSYTGALLTVRTMVRLDCDRAASPRLGIIVRIDEARNYVHVRWLDDPPGCLPAWHHPYELQREGRAR